MRIAIVSLGCPKNQVDADRFTRALLDAGHVTVPDVRQAQAVIVNTCGFIDSAKEEAIETILRVCALKEGKQGPRVIVTGCLAERYREEVAREIPEVDAVVGIGCNAELPAILERLGGAEPCAGPVCRFAEKTALCLDGPRVVSTPAHYAFLKIADGCANRCAYCAIPAIRGPLRSRGVESVLQEAAWLAGQGVKELVLVAQDVTAYGDDAGEARLLPLLERLEEIKGIAWIRLLYAYPERITKALLRHMANSKKLVPYLDMPIQHCNEEILRSMGRRGGAAAVRGAVEMVRAVLPGAVLRTTLIAGYPGESEEQFEELCAFVRAVRFDRLGCFAYSPEEGTPAAALPNQVPEEQRRRRAELLMELQQRILLEKQEAMAGQTLRVLCDGWDAEENAWQCRGAADAPEIDACVWVRGEAKMQAGAFYTVCVTGAQGPDLTARLQTPRSTADKNK